MYFETIDCLNTPFTQLKPDIRTYSSFKKSMLEQKLNTFKIKDGDMEKRISTLTEKEEEWALTRKMLDDANEDLKRYLCTVYKV